jgi:hypothetical protein
VIKKFERPNKKRGDANAKKKKKIEVVHQVF